jgi:TPR repeat protein
VTEGKHGVTRNPKEAFEWFLRAAEVGSTRGMFLVGQCFLQGNGIPRDFEKAAKYFQAAYQQGDELAGLELALLCACSRAGFTMADAIKHLLQLAASANSDIAVRAKFHLSRCYGQQTGAEHNGALAEQLLKEAAEKWEVDPQIMIGLGAHYESKHHFAEAADCYRKAAGRGQRAALHKLALCTHRGLGVPRDEAAALELFGKAAELGDASSMLAMGKHEYRRDNSSEARAWFEKAYAQFQADAQATCSSETLYKLGKMCLKRRGIETQSDDECVRFLQQGCKGPLPSPDCMLLLGRLYALGITGGPPVEEKEAFQLVQRAVELGSSKALYHMATYCKDGVGCDADEAKSRRLLEEAAAKGYSRALWDLALLLLEEDQMPRAVALLRRLSSPPFYGETMGMALGKLGFLYRDAEVVLPPEEQLSGADRQKEALRLLTEAGKLGDTKAFLEAARMHSQGIGTVASGETAVKLFEAAWTAWRSGEAARCLGTIYLEGLGVPEDKRKAMQYYFLAASEGDCDATFNLACCFDHGVGCDRNEAEALKWYHAAADKFLDDEAVASLAAIYYERKDWAKAFKYALEYVEKGDTKLQPLLADLYARGLGTAQDLVKAKALGWTGAPLEESESEAAAAAESQPSRVRPRTEDEQNDDVQLVIELEAAEEVEELKTPVARASAAKAGSGKGKSSPKSKSKLKSAQRGSATKRAKVEEVTPVRAVAAQVPETARVRTPSMAANVVPRRSLPLAPSPGTAKREHAEASPAVKAMRRWSIDKVVSHFVKLGCEAEQAQVFQRQKIDGEALSYFSDWRMLKEELGLPIGVCMKHEAFLTAQK